MVVSALTGDLPRTDDAPKYDALRTNARLLGWVRDNTVERSGRLKLDEEAGLLLLTDTVKKTSTEDKVEAFFTSAPIATYEIGRGKKLKPGLYAFPLALYSSAPGKEKLCHPRYSLLNVVKTGKEDWAIDKLP